MDNDALRQSTRDWIDLILVFICALEGLQISYWIPLIGNAMRSEILPSTWKSLVQTTGPYFGIYALLTMGGYFAAVAFKEKLKAKSTILAILWIALSTTIGVIIGQGMIAPSRILIPTAIVFLFTLSMLSIKDLKKRRWGVIAIIGLMTIVIVSILIGNKLSLEKLTLNDCIRIEEELKEMQTWSNEKCWLSVLEKDPDACKKIDNSNYFAREMILRCIGINSALRFKDDPNFNPDRYWVVEKAFKDEEICTEKHLQEFKENLMPPCSNQMTCERDFFLCKNGFYTARSIMRE